MVERRAYQVKNFVYNLEKKLEADKYERWYGTLPYWKKIKISLVRYLKTFYLSGKSSYNHYSFDFEIDRHDVQYFIDKYKPMIEVLEEQERREELRRLEREASDLDRKKTELEQRIKEFDNGK